MAVLIKRARMPVAESLVRREQGAVRCRMSASLRSSLPPIQMGCVLVPMIVAITGSLDSQGREEVEVRGLGDPGRADQVPTLRQPSGSRRRTHVLISASLNGLFTIAWRQKAPSSDDDA